VHAGVLAALRDVCGVGLEDAVIFRVYDANLADFVESFAHALGEESGHVLRDDDGHVDVGG
jgi:hypothetical protein